MNNRFDEVKEHLRKLSIIKEALQALIHFNEEAISSLSWQNRFLGNSLISTSFAIDLYGSLVEPKVNEMSETDFRGMMNPLSNMVRFGTTFITLHRTKDVKSYLQTFEATASGGSAVFSASVADSTVNFIGFTHPQEPERARIQGLLETYFSQLKPEEDIRYIEERLPKILPNVAEDFKHFLANYYASKQNELKYQELIAFRTIFFMKLVEEFAKLHGCPDSVSRKEKITFFAFKSSKTTDPNAEKIAEAAFSLWKTLSTQDSSALSVKMGNVTASYIDLLFHNVLIVAATLLRQNENYW